MVNEVPSGYCERHKTVVTSDDGEPVFSKYDRSNACGKPAAWWVVPPQATFLPAHYACAAHKPKQDWTMTRVTDADRARIKQLDEKYNGEWRRAHGYVQDEINGGWRMG